MTRRGGRFLLLLAYVGFVSLGLPDGVLGVAWPSIRRTFGLSLDAVGPIFAVGTAGVIVSSFLSGGIVRRLGVGTLLAASCVLTGCAMAGYSGSPWWPALIALSFPLGLGAGAVDSGLNAFVSTRYSTRHVNWLHACWGIGATTGPAMMTAILRAGGAWRIGYAAIALAQVALGLCFFATRKRWSLSASDLPEEHRRGAPVLESLRLPAAWVGMLLFFVYCGAELSLGQWAYSLLVEGRGVAPVAAGTWVAVYWGSLTAGRFLIGAISNRIPLPVLVRLAVGGAIAGAALLSLRIAPLAFAGLALTGFCFAPIFPCLMSATPRSLPDRHIANVVGFQVGSGSLGLAVVPSLVGVAAERVGLEVLGPALLVLGAGMLVLHEARLRLAARRN